MKKEYKPLLFVEEENFESACKSLLPNFLSIEGPGYQKVYRLNAGKLMSGSFRISYYNSNYNMHERGIYDIIDDDSIDCLKYVRKRISAFDIEITESEFKRLQKFPVESLDKDNIFLWDKTTNQPVTKIPVDELREGE